MGQQVQDIPLTFGQRREDLRGHRTDIREIGQHAIGDGCAEQRLTHRNRPDGADHVRFIGVLQDVAAGSRPQRGEYGIVVLVQGHDQNTGGRTGCNDLTDGADAALARKLEVHQDNVGKEIEDHCHCLYAIARFAGHLEVLHARDERAQPFPVERMVFDNHDTKLFHGPLLT
jgi:hypothetical protein